MTDAEKFDLVKEAIADWKSNKLSNYAALIAISMIVSDGREPTELETQYGKELEPMAKWALTKAKGLCDDS